MTRTALRLNIRGTDDSGKEVFELRVGPSASYSEQNTLYSFEWGIVQPNGNKTVGKIIDQVWWSGETDENAFALLLAVMRTMEDQGVNLFDEWTPNELNL